MLERKVSEIAKAVSGCNASDTSVNENVDLLLASIKNTMSDQCATNGLFNQLMSDLRSEIIPGCEKLGDTWGRKSIEINRHWAISSVKCILY